MTDLILTACNSDGIMKFKYGEHILITHVESMYKWDIDIEPKLLTIEIKKDINNKLQEQKRNIDKGVKRVRVGKERD